MKEHDPKHPRKRHNPLPGHGPRRTRAELWRELQALITRSGSEARALRSSLKSALTKVEALMATNESLTKLADDLKTAVDTYQDREQATKTALVATIKDLRAQLAAGPPGITAAQGDAIAEKLQAALDDINTPVPEPEE